MLPEVPIQAASRHSTAQVHRVPKYRCLEGGNRRSERLLVQPAHLWFLAVPAPSQHGQTPCRVSGLGDAQQPQQMKYSLHHPGTRINPRAEEVESTALFFLDTSKDFSALLWWAKGNLLKNRTPAVIMDYLAISLKCNFKRSINSHREISRCNHWQKFNLRNFLMARKDSPAFPLISNIHICTVICTLFFLSVRKYLQYFTFSNLYLTQHAVFEKHHQIRKTTVNDQQNSTSFEIN